MRLRREKRKNLFKLSTLTIGFLCVSTLSTWAESKDDKCAAAKLGFENMQEKLFNTSFGDSPETLKSLETKKRKLLAKKSILETLAKLKQDRENFHKKLSPLNENSFFKDTTSIKENYKDMQKQVIANQILSTVGSSLELLTKNPTFLKVLNEKASKKLRNFGKSATDPLKAKTITYDSMLKACESFKEEGNQLRGCDVFHNYKQGKIDEGYFTNGQDFVEDVTNNFFKAVKASGGNLEDANFVEHLKSIKEESILKNISEKDLKEIGNENIALLDAASHLQYLKSGDLKESEKSQKVETFTEQKELLSFDQDYKELKKCLIESSFVQESVEGCNKSGNKNLTNFVSSMMKVSDESEQSVKDAIKSAADQMKDYYKGADKNERGHIFRDKQVEINLSALKNLGSKNALSEQMKSVCKDQGFSDNLTIETLNSEENKKKFWDCSVSLGLTDQEANDNIEKVEAEIAAQEAKIEKLHKNKDFDELNELTKYSAFLANRKCNFKSGEETDKYISSCGNDKNAFVALTIGDDSFLTNLNNLDWSLTGKGKAEKFLAPLASICTDRNSKMKRVEQQSKNEGQTSEELAKIKETLDGMKEIHHVCRSVESDYNEILSRTPSPEVVQSHRDYTYKYNASTGTMDRTEKSSWASKIGASAGKSALNNGLPLLLGNMTFKNTLPYSTNMAIYKKNQLYFLNNPEYMFSGSYFSGYGLSGTPTYYGAPSYYGF